MLRTILFHVSIVPARVISKIWPHNYLASVQIHRPILNHTILFFLQKSKAMCVGLLSLVQKHSLTNSCVTDLLKLFAIKSGTLPSSVYRVNSKFIDYKDYVKIYQCCGHCTQLLPSGKQCSILECHEVILKTHHLCRWT